MKDGPLFFAKILGRRDSNLERFIEEGARIEEGVLEGHGAEMNIRGEWGRISIRRVGVLDTIQE